MLSPGGRARGRDSDADGRAGGPEYVRVPHAPGRRAGGERKETD